MKSNILPLRFSFLWLGLSVQLFLVHSLYAQQGTSVRDSIVFKHKKEPYTWIVPKNVTQIHVEAYGAQGGGESGGKGGKVVSDLTVTPGSTLLIRVGGQPTGKEAGYNGGGKGCGNGTGGGGASDIRTGEGGLDTRVLVAGGGGGVGFLGFSGAGGDLTGAEGGYDSVTEFHLAKGGTQDAGGAGAQVYFSPPGVKGKGGDGISSRGVCINDAMAGGGGGYYGGGGGGAGGGGGGSSFTGKNSTNVIHTQGAAEGNGRVIFYWNKP